MLIGKNLWLLWFSFIRCVSAFDTPTGLPYGTVNLKYGVPSGETPVTCTAGVGTFIVEFGALSRLTGNAKYEAVANRAMDAIWERRSKIGLVSHDINTQYFSNNYPTSVL